MAEELLTLRRSVAPALLRTNKGRPSCSSEQMDAGAYRGLADIQPLGRTDEIAGVDDFKECPDDFGVHQQTPAIILLQTPEIFRLSELGRPSNVSRLKWTRRKPRPDADAPLNN